MPGRRKVVAVGAFFTTVALAAVGVVVWGGELDRDLSVSVAAPDPIQNESAQIALAELAQLEDAESEAAIADYRRDYFGGGWATVGGCSIRNLVLERDLVDVQWLGADCVVAAGTLHDPYTGKQLEFQHDAVAEDSNPGSQGVQIDHVVSLRAAWFGGAYLWTAEERETFANDLENLVAVDGPANNSKNALGPSDWFVPENAAHRCSFATQYVQVNANWQLAISNADRAALRAQLERCV